MLGDTAFAPIFYKGSSPTMKRFSPFRGLGQRLLRKESTSRARAKQPHRRRPRMEWLEERQLLTWVATFVNSTGTLTIQGVGTSSDTGVLKVDPNSGEILLDGNNSGNFADTGANLATINSQVPIQIEAGTTINSNFIIDNNAGAFFEAPANFQASSLFNYTGSTALNPNDSLTIRGTAGVADTFEVALNPNSDKVVNGTTSGESGTVLLAQPPNQLNQRNDLTVTFGNVAGTVPGVSGHLTLDGLDGAGGNDQLYIDDAGATVNPSNPGTPSAAGAASDWTLNGNAIAGPQSLLPTKPPTPTPPPGTAGNITYANMAGLHFNDTVGGEHLFVNSVATPTFASDVAANTTVVNYNQPLAFAFSLQGVQNSAAGGGGNSGGATLDIVGAANGNNDFYVDSSTVALASTGTKPQYNTPFTHLGADLTYTEGSLTTLNVAGNGGNNIFTVQVPPVLVAPYTSNTLPTSFTVYGGALPPVFAGTQPAAATPGTNLLRVYGNNPGPLTTGADTITITDVGGAANNNNAGTVIAMSNMTAAVIYGENGNDVLTNDSLGNAKTGLAPVPALLIGGNGNDTLTGGGGNDMLLGGGPGQKTLISQAVSTAAKPTTTYFFPHQDQFGNIYDPLLGTSTTSTMSTITGTGGNQVVVTGAVSPANSVAVDPNTGSTIGDTDTGNLAFGGAGTGSANGGQTLSYPTVPPTNVTAPLYMVTPALTALEQAFGTTTGPFAANEAALLEFGGNVNFQTQFASPAAFVGRAYNDFMVDRGGSGTFAATANGGSTASQVQGGSLVSSPEIDYWAQQINNGMSVQSMQAQLLASPELRQTLPGGAMWVRFLYEAVTGSLPPDPVLTADTAFLASSDTTATRYALALNLLNSPVGQAAEIQDAYTNVVPGSGGPTPTNLAAIQADLAAGESLPQVAQTMGQSNGNYLNYEMTNDVGVVGFISTVYQDVLHRTASPGELSYWASVRGAGVSNTQLAQMISSSGEAKSFIVAAAYEKYLGRAPDPGGMAFWVGQLVSGMSDEQFVSLIASSPEYYANQGSTSQGFIIGLYRDILGRTAPPSQPEIDYWVSVLAQSSRGAQQARADVVLGFEQSPEYRGSLITGWYQAFDGRLPTAAELQIGLLQFASGATDEQVEAQILAARATG
jgi:hypothetical protein